MAFYMYISYSSISSDGILCGQPMPAAHCRHYVIVRQENQTSLFYDGFKRIIVIGPGKHGLWLSIRRVLVIRCLLFSVPTVRIVFRQV